MFFLSSFEKGLKIHKLKTGSDKEKVFQRAPIPSSLPAVLYYLMCADSQGKRNTQAICSAEEETESKDEKKKKCI